MGCVIRTEDLSRRFGDRPALDGVSLDVEEGEIVALLGPNGAGKTTTVRLLNGVLRPDRGRADVLGLDPWTDGTELRRRTGVLTETAGLDDRLTARENLVLVAGIRGIERTDARGRAGELLERLGMAADADRSVQGFSTGQRKRVALALALLHDPEVLFLDEPTSGLDPAASRDVVELIADLARERHRTVMLCTHFLGDAGRLCHRMAVLHRGRLKAFGTTAELAAGLWRGIVVDLDFGRPAAGAELTAVASSAGVLAAEGTGIGARVRVADREAVPPLVSSLVARHVPVYGAVPRPPTLEDVYFALQDGDWDGGADGR
ncbi:MAG TPA: ABC transporter ATP-binding protein [Acidimicrobiales bacterium]|nr:ABC transporter ATP-binding protein [Acidimicrobiales bacterium]